MAQTLSHLVNIMGAACTEAVFCSYHTMITSICAASLFAVLQQHAKLCITHSCPRLLRVRSVPSLAPASSIRFLL